MEFTPGRQMGWPDLFEASARAREIPTRIYDAACGFGGIMDELFRDPVPEHLLYVGADIHGALGDIDVPKNVRTTRFSSFVSTYRLRFPSLNRLTLSSAAPAFITRRIPPAHSIVS